MRVRRRAQWKVLNARDRPTARLHFCDRRAHLRRGVGASCCRRVEIRAGPPRLLAAQELRAAGDDARPCRRRHPPRGIFAGAAPLSPLLLHSRSRQAGVHFCRGQELLHPSGFRPRGHRPRRLRLFSGLAPRPGRFDHHPAGGEKLPAELRPHVRSQDPRDPAQPADRVRPTPRRRFSSSTSTRFISASPTMASRRPR